MIRNYTLLLLYQSICYLYKRSCHRHVEFLVTYVSSPVRCNSSLHWNQLRDIIFLLWYGICWTLLPAWYCNVKRQMAADRLLPAVVNVSPCHDLLSLAEYSVWISFNSKTWRCFKNGIPSTLNVDWSVYVLLAVWRDGPSNSINDISTPSTCLPDIFSLHGPPKGVPGNAETLKHWLYFFTGEGCTWYRRVGLFPLQGTRRA